MTVFVQKVDFQVICPPSIVNAVGGDRQVVFGRKEVYDGLAEQVLCAIAGAFKESIVHIHHG